MSDMVDDFLNEAQGRLLDLESLFPLLEKIRQTKVYGQLWILFSALFVPSRLLPVLCGHTVCQMRAWRKSRIILPRKAV